MNFPHLSMELAASAWAKPTTSHIQMDTELCKAFAEILDSEISKPSLGCATTGQMLDEIKSRVDCNYSTVFHEEVKPPCTP